MTICLPQILNDFQNDRCRKDDGFRSSRVSTWDSFLLIFFKDTKVSCSYFGGQPTVKDTLPDLSEVKAETKRMDRFSSRNIIEVLNKTNTMTQSVTENIYLNLTNGNPLTASDTAVLCLGAGLVGCIFGFFIGVSFTAIFTFIVVVMLRLV